MIKKYCEVKKYKVQIIKISFPLKVKYSYVSTILLNKNNVFIKRMQNIRILG